MVTILDYIRWTVHQPFSIQAAGTVDSLVFCYLSYLDLRSILPEGGALSVAACCHAALETNAALKTVDGGPGHEEVLRALISSRRFAPVLITDYTDLLDEQAQFSAEVFLLPEGLPLVAFRGTDDSLAGWKEDFMLSFTQPPSQTMALEYLQRAIAKYGTVDVTGHSKGGNLAWYAASRLPTGEQAQLAHIWLNDSPGLCPEVLDPAGIAAIRERAELTLPVSSVIGRIFQADAGQVHIVQAEGSGLLQHDLARWGIAYGELLEAPDFDAFSEWVDAALKRWLSAVSLEQRRSLVDQLFESLGATGATTLQQLSSQGPAAFMEILGRLAGMKPAAVRTIAQLVPAALAPELELARKPRAPARWLQWLRETDGGQALAMIIGGVLLAVLPDWFLTQAIPWLLAAGALLQLGLSLAKLARTGWDLRRERMRMTLGMLALGIAVILLVKDHAPFLLLSAGLGGLFLLLAYHHAIHAREAGRRHPVRRGRSALFAVLYAAAGMFILVAPARLIASFSLASGLALLADGLVSLFTALCGRWQLRQRHRDAC